MQKFACWVFLLFATAIPARGAVEASFIPINLGIGGEEALSLLAKSGYETTVTRQYCPPERKIIDGKVDLRPRTVPQPRTKTEDSCFLRIKGTKVGRSINIGFGDSALPPFDRTVVADVEYNRTELNDAMIDDIKKTLINLYGDPTISNNGTHWSWVSPKQRIHAFFSKGSFTYTIDEDDLIVPEVLISEFYGTTATVH